MWALTKQNDEISYGICEFVIEDKEDLKSLPNCNMGSSALNILTGELYFKDSSGAWAMMK